MKFFRYCLFPFSLLFLLLSECRNFLYQTNILKSSRFSIPVISVGNLSLGGTGKTPHVAYLIALLKNSFHVSVLSRGYGRKSKGFILLDNPFSAKVHGDEPMIYKKNNHEIPVAVCEQRVKGILQLLTEKPLTDVVLLDDAYQHRPIKPGLNILLCDYHNPFFSDFIIPVGNLRELRKNAKRADLIIVSKCPENLRQEDKNIIIHKIKKYSAVQVFFSRIVYGNFYPVFNSGVLTDVTDKKIILITAIAHATPFYTHLNTNNHVIKHFKFSDHYNFKENDIKLIAQEFSKNPDAILITTEKDAMRFISLPDKQINDLKSLPFYYQTINVTFDEKQPEFDKLILDYVTTTARDYRLHTYENENYS